MSFTVQHKRSDEENRRPLPTDLAEGQVAINTSDETPGMFFRTKNAALVKVGSCHVSDTAPAPTNYTQLSKGEMWLDTTSGINRLRVWDGNQWLTTS